MSQTHLFSSAIKDLVTQYTTQKSAVFLMVIHLSRCVCIRAPQMCYIFFKKIY